MSKKCHFDKHHSKVIPIERSHAAKETHCTYIAIILYRLARILTSVRAR